MVYKQGTILRQKNPVKRCYTSAMAVPKGPRIQIKGSRAKTLEY